MEEPLFDVDAYIQENQAQSPTQTSISGSPEPLFFNPNNIFDDFFMTLPDDCIDWARTLTREEVNSIRDFTYPPPDLPPPPEPSVTPPNAEALAKEGTKKERKRFPEEAHKKMRRWLIRHHEYPYPTLREKALLAQTYGMTKDQVNTFCNNCRQRLFGTGYSKRIQRKPPPPPQVTLYFPNNDAPPETQMFVFQGMNLPPNFRFQI